MYNVYLEVESDKAILVVQTKMANLEGPPNSPIHIIAGKYMYSISFLKIVIMYGSKNKLEATQYCN